MRLLDSTHFEVLWRDLPCGVLYWEALFFRAPVVGRVEATWEAWNEPEVTNVQEDVQ